MQQKSLLGGILLVIGTSIGGAMLALPIAAAHMGFLYGTLMLFVAWIVMTLGAFLILEVNLWLPENSNLISMARKTIGKYGQVLTWVVYLLLLYSLVSAYTSGGAEVVRNIMRELHWAAPFWVDELIFVGLLGAIVYHGIRAVDYVNRGFMLLKFTALILLFFLLTPHVSLENYLQADSHYILSSVTIMITSFGYATIIPSLRVYYRSDAARMRKIIFLGSCIPLVCYIAWIAIVLGVLPLHGEHGLMTVIQASDKNTALTDAIAFYLQSHWITDFWQFFITVSIGTSFLGVSLGLSDFLADGLKIPKKGKKKLLISALTFLPPLVIVLFYPNVFVEALSYAGIFCLILLVFLPIIMAWHGRYTLKIASGFRVVGGKPLLIVLGIVAIGLMKLCRIEPLGCISFLI